METVEKQYAACLELRQQQGIARLGIVSNLVWHEDPRHMTFVLSRYKFVAKMMEGRKHVFEIGCGDAFASRIVLQAVDQLTAVDIDPLFIEDALERADLRWPMDLRVHDILEGPVDGKFDAAYAVDVLEHIPKASEDRFLRNVHASLDDHAMLIIGMPSLESQVYAGPRSSEGHVNCKTAPDLEALMKRYFQNVTMFSMNDEVVHTGFHKMAHYLFALGFSKRPTPLD